MIQVLETNLGMIPTLKAPFKDYNGIISTIPTGVKSTAYRSFHWIRGSIDLWPLRTFAWCFHGGSPVATPKTILVFFFFGRLVRWKEVVILT